MVRYANETEVARLDPAELSERLVAVLRGAMPWLLTLSEGEASVPKREGKWSAKQVIGHLIDSAVNNTARMIRMQIESCPSLSGYEQMDWVRLQHYGEREWSQVLGLWFALNEQVAWMVGHVEPSSLANSGEVEGETVTLGFLIADYVAHMEHHLRAMRLWLGITGEARG
jgi:DinB superfamily